MRQLRTLLATAAVFFFAVVASYSNNGVWLPVIWEGCDPIVAPWHASSSDVMSGLRRAGVIGAHKAGNAENGTLVISIQDGSRNQMVQLIFDQDSRYIGAATLHKTSSAENTLAFIGTTVGRLVMGGATILSRSQSSTDLRIVCRGVELTVTVGISADDPLTSFLNVMTEQPTMRSASNR